MGFEYIPVKIANYPLLYWWINSSYLWDVQHHKNDPESVNLVSLILAWLSLTLVVIFRITPSSGLIIDQICRQFLHISPVSLVVIILLKYFWSSHYCYICGRCVKDFYGIERQFLTFFCILFPTKAIVCFPILTISLQVNFYQINFI